MSPRALIAEPSAPVSTAIRRFLEGAGFDVLIGQLWPMAVIGGVSLILASRLFRHRLY